MNIWKSIKKKFGKNFLKADDEENENEEPDLEPYDFDSSTDLGEDDDDPNSDSDTYDSETDNGNFFGDEGENKEETESDFEPFGSNVAKNINGLIGEFGDIEATQEEEARQKAEFSEDDEEPDDEDEEWASSEESNATQLEDSDGTKSAVNQESNETQPDETAQQEIFELANQEKFIKEFERQFPIVDPEAEIDEEVVNFSKLVSVYNYEGQEIKKREDGSLLARLGLEVDDKRSFLNAINKVEKVKQLLDEKFDNRIEEQKNVVDEKQKSIDQNQKKLDDAKKLDLSKATIKSIKETIKSTKGKHKEAVEVYNSVVKQVKSYKKIIEKQYKEYVKPAKDSSIIDDFNSVEKRLVDFCLALGISPTIISKIQVPSLPGSFTWYKFEATNAEEKLKQRNLTKDTSLLNIIDALEKLDISGDDQFKELIREARIAAGDIGMSIAIIRQAVSADEKKIDEYCLNPQKLQVEINNRLAEVCAGGDIKNPIVVPEVLEHIKLQLDFEKRLEKNAEEGWSTKKSKKNEGDKDQEDKERWKFPAEFLFKIELCHFILSEAKDDNKVDKIYKDLAKKADERNIFEQLKQSKSNDKVGENYESMFEQLEDLFESFRGSDIKNYQTKISRDLGSKGEKQFWTRLNKTGIIKSEADHKLKSEYMFPSDGKVQEELDEIQDSFRASATQAAKNTQQKASSTIDSAITTPKETQPSETSKGKKRDEDEKKAEEKQEKYKNMYRKELLGKLYPTYFAEKRYIDLVDTYCFRYLTKYRNQLEKELSNNPDNQTNESSLSDSDKLKIMGLICLMAKPKETPGETKIIDSISGETEDEGEDQEEEEEGNSEASKNEAQQNGGNDNPPPIVSDYNPPELKSDHEPPELKSDHEPPELKSDHEPPELKSDHEPPELKSDHEPPELKSDHEPPELRSDHEPPELKSDYEYPKIISDYMSKAILNSYRDGTSIKGEDLKFISSFLNVPPKDLATSPVYLKFLILSKTFNLTPKFWIQFMKNKKVDLNLFMDVFSEYFTAYEVFPNQEDNPHSNEIKDLKNTLSENQKNFQTMKSNENQSNDNQNISNENVKSDVGDKYNVYNIDDINFNDFNEVQECWRYLRAKYRIIIMCIAKNTKVMSGKQANLVQQTQKKIEEGDERFLSKNFRNSNAKVLISNAKLFFKNLTNSLHGLEEDGDIKQYLGTRYLNAIKDRQSMIKENSGSDAIITDDNWKIKL